MENTEESKQEKTETKVTGLCECDRCGKKELVPTKFTEFYICTSCVLKRYFTPHGVFLQDGRYSYY